MYSETRWPQRIGFSVKREGALAYSDPEKTVLDFIYLSRQEGVPPDKVAADVSSWARNLSKGKLRKYAEKYPKTVARIAEEAVR